MYLDISSMKIPSMGGRQHWVLLVDEATKYRKSFFLKKKNEQVEPIIDWIKALKARHKIQVKIISSEFVTARTQTEQIMGIRQTLRYLGTPISSNSDLLETIDM